MFVAINDITCRDDHRVRFEELFKSRAKAIDRLHGFFRHDCLSPSEDRR
jgi:heme-degrading monooxygenase HmoA